MRTLFIFLHDLISGDARSQLTKPAATMSMPSRMQFAVILLAVCGQATASMTYNLYLDGILSPKVTSLYLRGDGESAEPVPDTLLKDLSSQVMGELVNVYNVTALKMITEMSTSDSPGVEDECVVASDDISCQQIGGCGKCVLQYGSKEGGMQLDMSVRLHENNDIIDVRTEVTLTAPTSAVARETLTRMVPKVEDKLGCNGSSIWSIQHQPSMLETMASTSNLVETVVTNQEDKDRRAASIDELILGNALMKNRTRLDYVSATSKKPRHLEVWSFEDVKFIQSVKSLFIDGYLATTSAPAGIAHAEALVHPAMVAHPSPKRALVISLAPNAIVKEVLKYKSIEHVTVVGSDVDAVKLVEKHMPSFNDCSFLGPDDSQSCMESAAVKLVKEDLYTWLDAKRELPESFDVMFVDVPIGKHEWLSLEMYKKLKGLTARDSAFVVSSGSSPSLFDVNTETVLSPRENLIRQAARNVEYGGLNAYTLLYDEVRSLEATTVLPEYCTRLILS